MTNEEIQNILIELEVIKNDILNIKYDLENIRNTIPLTEIRELLDRKYDILSAMVQVYNIKNQLEDSVVLIRRINGKEA